MSQELHFTSAPRGLRPGSKDYCTVAATAGMTESTTRLLEGLSGYRWVFPPSGPQAAQNPVAFAHYRIVQGTRQFDVLSRVCSSGLDYTKRSNKYGHHIVLERPELPKAGPAWLARQKDFFEEEWSGEPCVIPKGRDVPQGERPPGICKRWGKVTGDPGWAGVVARSLVGAERGKRTVFLVFKPGQDLLPLVEEALALLEPSQRWEVNFNTYFTGLTLDVPCHVRGVLADSEEAKQAARLPGGEVIDLTGLLGMAEDDPWVEAARTGDVPEALWAPPEPVRRPSPARSPRPARREADDTPQFTLGEAPAPPPPPPSSRPVPRRTASGLGGPDARKWLLVVGPIGAVAILVLGIVLGKALSPGPDPKSEDRKGQQIARTDPPESDIERPRPATSGPVKPKKVPDDGPPQPGPGPEPIPVEVVADTNTRPADPPVDTNPVPKINRPAPKSVETISQMLREKDGEDHRDPFPLVQLDPRLIGKVKALRLAPIRRDETPRFSTKFEEGALHIFDGDPTTSPVARVDVRENNVMFAWQGSRNPEMAARLRDHLLVVEPEDTAAPNRLYYLRTRIDRKVPIELGKKIDDALLRAKTKETNRELTGTDIDWGPEQRPTVPVYWGAYVVMEDYPTEKAPSRDRAPAEGLSDELDLPALYDDWRYNEAFPEDVRKFFIPTARRVQIDNAPTAATARFQKVHIDLIDNGKVLQIAPDLVKLASARYVGEFTKLDDYCKSLGTQIAQATAQSNRERVGQLQSELSRWEPRLKLLQFIRSLYRVKIVGTLCVPVEPPGEGPTLIVELARFGVSNN
jgi:hypothetical protein